ncbi:MAG: MlaD family protein [Verrucomicrobiota bacterium]
MNDQSNRTTLIAGIFVLCGLSLLGGLIFQFGTLRHRMRQPYQIYANFLDSQNLIKGAPVKRAGATIGQVVTSPKLVDGLKGVQVTLEIYPEFRIPTTSPLRINSVGLMGDSVIDVGQPADAVIGEFIHPGDTVTGSGSPDLTATANRITDEIMVVMRDLRTGLADLNKTVIRLNEGVLSDENLNNVAASLRSLKEAIAKVDHEVLSDANTNALKESITKFRTAMENVDAAAARANSAIAKFDKGMDGFGPAMKGAEGATLSLKEAATALKGLLSDARSGDGLLNAMLNNKALREDVIALVTNLRHRGLLFYKDKPVAGAAGGGDGRTGETPKPVRATPPKPYGKR